MPKISSHTQTIYRNGNGQVIKFDVHYSDCVFYVNIPESYSETFDLIPESKRLEFFMKKDRVNRSKSRNIIFGQTEGEAFSRYTPAIKFLMDQVVKERDVIIIFFNPSDNCRYVNFRENEQHPQIGFQFGLTYAKESLLPGGEPNYFQAKEHKSPFRNEIDRSYSRISTFGKTCTVIDDTEENREVLEDMYRKLALLRDRITEFTESSDTVMKFISSNQKLLS